VNHRGSSRRRQQPADCRSNSARAAVISATLPACELLIEGKFYRISPLLPPLSPADPALPPPSPEAQAHSAALSRRIGAEIAAGGGWIGFDRYMELALYAPGLGYYTGGSSKLGASGDFVTAPELTSLFALRSPGRWPAAQRDGRGGAGPGGPAGGRRPAARAGRTRAAPGRYPSSS
jgi:hypothetical protein